MDVNVLCPGIFNGDAPISFMVISHHAPGKIDSLMGPSQVSLIEQMPQRGHNLQEDISNHESQDPAVFICGRTLIANPRLRHALRGPNRFLQKVPPDKASGEFSYN